MKQKHYHLYVLSIALLILASGGLTVSAWFLSWPVSLFCLGIVVSLALLAMIYKAASFLPDQVKYFLGCVLNHDAMSRFPDTCDVELQQMYQNMNRIMQKYGQFQIELETKRLYYDRILRIMTHELRNSITPIITLSEDMLKREYSKKDNQEAIEVINEQCVSIKQFLDSYYELTHLPMPMIKETKVRDLLLTIERLYPDMIIAIQCAQGLNVMCDEGQIKQVLINLVKNSIEAMGSEKIEELKSKKIPAIVITASAPEGKTRIIVIDKGPGISQGKQEEIFLPFYTSKTTGSGIGLALSRQIMNLHKGSLTCSSNESDGAMFILQF